MAGGKKKGKNDDKKKSGLILDPVPYRGAPARAQRSGSRGEEAKQGKAGADFAPKRGSKQDELVSTRARTMGTPPKKPETPAYGSKAWEERIADEILNEYMKGNPQPTVKEEKNPWEEIFAGAFEPEEPHTFGGKTEEQVADEIMAELGKLNPQTAQRPEEKNPWEEILAGAFEPEGTGGQTLPNRWDSSPQGKPAEPAAPAFQTKEERWADEIAREWDKLNPGWKIPEEEPNEWEGIFKEAMIDRQPKDGYMTGLVAPKSGFAENKIGMWNPKEQESGHAAPYEEAISETMGLKVGAGILQAPKEGQGEESKDPGSFDLWEEQEYNKGVKETNNIPSDSAYEKQSLTDMTGYYTNYNPAEDRQNWVEWLTDSQYETQGGVIHADRPNEAPPICSDGAVDSEVVKKDKDNKGQVPALWRTVPTPGDKIPYVVLPDIYSPEERAALMGCVCAIVVNRGTDDEEIVYGIVSEVGPKWEDIEQGVPNEWGEISNAAYTAVTGVTPSGNYVEPINHEIMVFAGSKQDNWMEGVYTPNGESYNADYTEVRNDWVKDKTQWDKLVRYDENGKLKDEIDWEIKPEYMEEALGIDNATWNALNNKIQQVGAQYYP